MNDYSDIIFLMAAMIMLSMVTLNTSKTYLSSPDQLIRTQLEYRTLAAAQSEIDQARFITDPRELRPWDNRYIYSDHPLTKTISYGDANQYTEEIIITAVSARVENSATMERFRITVTASSTALTPNINVEMDYLKSFMN